MTFCPGQGILGCIDFVDGTAPQYPRTYLVVAATSSYIEILNVSSIKGKERKLAFPFNKRIINYNPPFLKPSFVKLDSLKRVPSNLWTNIRVLHNGDVLDAQELSQIISAIK